MVVINGEAVQAAGMNVRDYLAREGYAEDRVVVERNREILPREQLETTVLQDGDEVEILCFVGGG
jgi:sulfur carrier protein